MPPLTNGLAERHIVGGNSELSVKLTFVIRLVTEVL